LVSNEKRAFPQKFHSPPCAFSLVLHILFGILLLIWILLKEIRMDVIYIGIVLTVFWLFSFYTRFADRI